MPDAEEAALEGKGLAALIQDPVVDLPEDYENPGELMRSIYKIQGREIPVEEAEKASAEEDIPDEERLWTVDEIVASQDEGDAEEPVMADADLDAIIDDVLGD